MSEKVVSFRDTKLKDKLEYEADARRIDASVIAREAVIQGLPKALKKIDQKHPPQFQPIPNSDSIAVK